MIKDDLLNIVKKKGHCFISPMLYYMSYYEYRKLAEDCNLQFYDIKNPNSGEHLFLFTDSRIMEKIK